jgi:hypothetical protein
MLICTLTVPSSGVIVAVGEGGGGVELGRVVWLWAGVGVPPWLDAGVAEPFDGATGLQAAASNARVNARIAGFNNKRFIILYSILGTIVPKLWII